MTRPPTDDAHQWVAAANIRVDRRRAEVAARSGRMLISHKLQVEVVDVYCKRCRTTYENGRDLPCRIGPQHIGGPRRQPDLPQLTGDEEEPW